MEILLERHTLVVIAGAILLGMSCGGVGTYALLRKRALIGDALSHAAFPGVCLAFLAVGGKELSALLIGAFATCLLATALLALIQRQRLIPADASLAIVLSIFFSAGVVLSRVIQNRGISGQAGLHSYIFGRAASMLEHEVLIIAAIAILVLFCLWVFQKEFALLCFSAEFATSLGVPVKLFDLLLLVLTLIVIVTGLPAVGLLLVVALIVIPPAAAKLWGTTLSSVVRSSILIGGLSGLTGSLISIAMPSAPTGPWIVISAFLFLALSLLLKQNKITYREGATTEGEAH